MLSPQLASISPSSALLTSVMTSVCTGHDNKRTLTICSCTDEDTGTVRAVVGRKSSEAKITVIGTIIIHKVLFCNGFTDIGGCNAYTKNGV